MKHVIALFAVISLATACGASQAPIVDPANPDVPAPQIRTPEEPAAAPAILSITPSSGSSKTRWTLHGTGLTGVTDVWFGDSNATIESIDDSTIVVTNAFGVRDSMGILPVAIDVGGERIVGPSVFGHPDGTVRESANEARTWYRTTSMAANASTIYVADSTRGIYAFDRANDTVAIVAKNGDAGIEVATGVFVSPTGQVFASDETSEGNRRLLRRDGMAFTAFAVLAEPVVDLAFGSNGTLFAVGATSVRKFLADGTEVLSFQPHIVDEIGGAFLQNGSLFVTQRWNGTILSIDPIWGAVTDLAISGLSTPGAISGNGTKLYVADDYGLQTVDGDGNVATFASAYTPFASYGSIDSLVVSGSTVLASEALGTIVADLAAPSIRIAAAGIGPTFATAHVGDALVLSSYETCFDAAGTGSELPAGVVYVLTAGSARIVSRDVCPVSGLGSTNDGAVLYTSASWDGGRSEVGRLHLATGSRTVLATEADGLVYPMTAVEDASGNVYVAEVNFSTGAGIVSRIDASGTFASAWAQSANGYTWSLAVSGDKLWMTDLYVIGLWTVSLAEGGVSAAVPGTESLLPTADGLIAADDGVLVADLVSGAIQRVDAQGSVTQAVSGFSGAIELNAATGDLQIVAAGEGVHLTEIMP